MTPNDWSETEARRAERAERADRPHGREISAGSRRATAWILALIGLGLIVYAMLGWLGIISVPGFNS